MNTYEYILPTKFPYMLTKDTLKYQPTIVFRCKAGSFEDADIMALANGHDYKKLECQPLLALDK